MNPFFNWLISNTVGKDLTRRCPKCYRRQIVPKEKENYTVLCKWCMNQFHRNRNNVIATGHTQMQAAVSSDTTTCL